MVAVWHGLELYLLLAVITTLAGRGLLRLLRLELPSSAALVFAPVLTFCFWTVALGIFVGVGLPVRLVSPPLWLATAVLAVFGLSRDGLTRDGFLALGVCLLLPLVVLHNRFGDGLVDNVLMVVNDGWVYFSGARYFWENGRHFVPGDTPIELLGAFYHSHRYITFSLLAHLSPLVEAGDPSHVVALLQAWTLYTIAAAVWAAWAAMGRPTGETAAATILACASGWMATVAWGNWLEQGLSLVYFPAAAAVLAAGDPLGGRRWVVLGGLLAGVWYTYPEATAPMATAGAGLLGLTAIALSAGHRRRWVLGGLAATGLAIALLAAGGPMLVRFTVSQFRAAFLNQGHGYLLFRGLLDFDNYPAALLGLGGETSAKTHMFFSNWIAWPLVVLLGIGVIAWLARRQFGLATCLAFFAAVSAFWMFGREIPYPYGAFKIISVAWWLAAGAIAAGGALIVRLFPVRFRGLTGGALVLGCAAACVLLDDLGPRAMLKSDYQELKLDDFAVVREVADLVKDGGLAVAVDDWLANQFALYHLRDQPFDLIAPRLWMHFSSLLHFMFDPEKAAREGIEYVLVVRDRRRIYDLEFVPLERVRYVLTDKPPWTADGEPSGLETHARCVWERGPYKLWRLDPDGTPTVTLDHVEPIPDDPRSVRRPRIDLDVYATDLSLFFWANRAGILRLQGEFVPGLTLDGDARRIRRRMEVATPKGPVGVFPLPADTPSETMKLDLRIPVHAGLNRVVMQTFLDPEPPGLDERSPEGLVRVSNLTFSLEEPGAGSPSP